MLNRDNFNHIKIFNFKSKDTELEFKEMIYDVILTIKKFLNENNIEYDYNSLNDKIRNLQIYYYEIPHFSYNNKKNILRLSLYDSSKKPFNDFDKRIFLTHELLHFYAFSGVARQFGFEEFFTEYLNYLIISDYSKELEYYYIKNYYGYFNELDFKFMKHLCDTVDFNQLLNAYFKRDKNSIDEIVGVDTLSYINDYFHYFWELYKRVDKPKKELNKLLVSNNQYLDKLQKINEYILKINESIDSKKLTLAYK